MFSQKLEKRGEKRDRKEKKERREGWKELIQVAFREFVLSLLVLRPIKLQIGFQKEGEFLFEKNETEKKNRRREGDEETG